jgi:hypothetical protein
MPVPRDRLAPRVGVALKQSLPWRRALARGLGLRVTCSEPCTLEGQLVLDARSAKTHRLGNGRRPVRVASGTAHAAGALVLRFTRSAQQRLRTLARVRLTLVLRATDGAGNAATLRRTVTLTRRGATLKS